MTGSSMLFPLSFFFFPLAFILHLLSTPLCLPDAYLRKGTEDVACTLDGQFRSLQLQQTVSLIVHFLGHGLRPSSSSGTAVLFRYRERCQFAKTNLFDATGFFVRNTRLRQQALQRQWCSSLHISGKEFIETTTAHGAGSQRGHRPQKRCPGQMP